MLRTELTELLGIKHPILLAGMNQAAGSELAAAVSNAGGLGVIGGVTYTPKMLRKTIKDLKSRLNNPNLPFGVDLLIPKVGKNARKTNYDYTNGNLPELIDIIIESGAKLFVCAVGVPPRWAVDKLHAANILVMNMVGAPKHIPKALEAGVDLICAQGGEGGGHTGDVPFSILIPKSVDLVKGSKSPLTGKQVLVVAAGGVFDGRGLASALAMGASAVWVGTRFVCATESSATKRHQQGIIDTGYHGTTRTIIFTGRPMRVKKTDYINDWETNRTQEIKELVSKGIIPHYNEIETKKWTMKQSVDSYPLLMGKAAGTIHEILPAKVIIDNMVAEAIEGITKANQCIKLQSKL